MSPARHRWVFPNHGVIKRLERSADRIASKHVFPRIFGLWHPYSWLLPRRFVVTDGTLAPRRWPDVEPLRVLLVSDIHTGPFLHPDALAPLLAAAMALQPDLVAIAGDVVTGRASDLDGSLNALSVLAAAPLGAWFAFGNHDYFSAESHAIAARLRSIGICVLRNETVEIRHGGGAIRIGGIDDRILGTPDWEALGAGGAPHLLIAHNPDDFYDAERRGVALVLSGHTHGGQIRLPGGRPLVRQSRYYLDEGLYEHGEALLVVSRGVGAVGLPWRAGADPEALLLEVRGPR
jgi:predicted MPP superfamily phosphohydrolase